MGIEDGIECHCLTVLETEFLGHFDSHVPYQLIRTYKFDAAEVIEYIAICRLYISLVISDPITELS